MTDNEFIENKQWLKLFINNICIQEVPEFRQVDQHELTRKMFYMRRGLFNPELLEVICKCFLHVMEPKLGRQFQIAGMETAAIPLVVGIPMIGKTLGFDINSFSVRKELKAVGLRNRLEGVVYDDVPIVMVDDLCTSGGTFVKCFDYIAEENFPISKYCFSIVSSDKKFHPKYGNMADMEIVSLFNLADVRNENE